MKRAIITPTYKGHFKYIKKYLESFDKYVSDKENIEIIFTISKDEKDDFISLIQEYKTKCNIIVLLFEDILTQFGVNESSDELLQKYKKFSFQTLKKFYTMLYSDADYFLVLDSESMWINQTNIKKLFDEYFSSPYIYYSKLNNRKKIKPIIKYVNDNVSYILEKSNDKWFIESFMWFYDKKILQDMFDNIGSPYELVNKVYNLQNKENVAYGVFEIELYQSYLFYNKDKYNYSAFCINDYLINTLSSKEFEDYLKSFYKEYNGACGLVENICVCLNSNNVIPLAQMFKRLNISIIRCDYTDEYNVNNQEQFLEIVKPSILAASQNHAWGINNKLNAITIHNKYYQKLEFYIAIFLQHRKIWHLLTFFCIIKYFLIYHLKKIILYKKYSKNCVKEYES